MEAVVAAAKVPSCQSHTFDMTMYLCVVAVSQSHNDCITSACRTVLTLVSHSSLDIDLQWL